MGIVPPRIEPPKTIIGVGMREAILLGSGFMLSILVVLSGMALILKAGLAALIMGLAALLALGRAPATGKTFEEYFLDIYHFHKRDRFMQRGVGELREERVIYQPASIENAFIRDATKGLVQMRPLPLSLNGVLRVLSLCFLVMLFVWLFFGGLQELLLRFGVQ